MEVDENENECEPSTERNKKAGPNGTRSTLKLNGNRMESNESGVEVKSGISLNFMRRNHVTCVDDK